MVRLLVRRLCGRLLRCLLVATVLLGVTACRDRRAASANDARRPDIEAAGEPVADGARAPAPPLMPVRRIQGEEIGPFTLAERMARLEVGAVSIAVVLDGRTAATWSYRLDASGSLVAIDDQTLFPGGLLSSPVSSALLGFAVLRWAALEGIDPDTPLSTWLSDPPIGAAMDEPTIAQVLGHSAGLDSARPPEPGSSPEAKLRALATGPGGSLPLADPPGRRHRYSPAGSLLLSRLLVTQSGKGLQQTVDELLLEPLGLSSTFLDGPPAGPAGRDSESSPGPVVPPGAAAEGGARSDLWTTSSDLARWVSALLVSARGVQPDAALPWPLARRALEPGPGGWGWGVRIVEPGPRFEVAVEGDGYAVLVLGQVASESGLAVMTADAAGARAIWLTREIANGVAREHGWPGFAVEVVEAEPPPSVARALVGRYRFEEGDLEVSFDRGRLRVEAAAGVLAADAVAQPIHPRNPLTYVFLDRPEVLTFVRGAGQGVRGLIVGERRAPRVTAALRN